MSIYKVKALNSITILVEAKSQQQAIQRAQSPQIIREFTRLVQQSLSQIIGAEPLKGPQHQIRQLVFDDGFFDKDPS